MAGMVMVLVLTAELDLMHDAIHEIERIFRALVKCHGHQYRQLELRIERLMDGDSEFGEPKTHWIGEGHVIFEPFPEMQSIIREARQLGVAA